MRQKGIHLFFFFMVMPLIVVAHFFLASAPSIFLAVSFVFYLGSLAAPVFFVSRESMPIHPLVLNNAFSGGLSLIGGELWLGLSGLNWHEALYGAADTELNFIVTKHFLLQTAALWFVYIGYYSFRRLPVPGFKRNVVRTYRRRLWICVLGVMVAVLYFAEATGGLGNLLMQRGMPVEERISSQIGGHYLFLFSLVKLIPILWISQRPNDLYRLNFIAILAVVLLISFISTGSRSEFVFIPLLCAVAYTVQQSSLPKPFLVGAMVFGFFAFTIIGAFRLATMGNEDLRSSLEQTTFPSLTEGFDKLSERRTTGWGQLGIIGTVPETVNHLYGESYLSVLFAPIPSVVLPFDKPKAAGKLSSERVFNRPSTAKPAGYVGEVFWNFSYAGIVVIFFLQGLLLRFLYCFLRSNRGNAVAVAFYLVGVLHLKIASDSLYEFLQQSVLLYILYVIATTVVRRKQAGALLVK